MCYNSNKFDSPVIQYFFQVSVGDASDHNHGPCPDSKQTGQVTSGASEILINGMSVHFTETESPLDPP
jgi:hypothetical protein